MGGALGLQIGGGARRREGILRAAILPKRARDRGRKRRGRNRRARVPDTPTPAASSGGDIERRTRERDRRHAETMRDPEARRSRMIGESAEGPLPVALTGSP